MVVVLSRSANVEFCPSKMFRTPVTPHATNLLLSEITVRQPVDLVAGVTRPEHPADIEAGVVKCRQLSAVHQPRQ